MQNEAPFSASLQAGKHLNVNAISAAQSDMNDGET